MRISLYLDKARLFRWHMALANALETQGHGVSVHFRDISEPLPASLTTILEFDQARGRLGPDRLSTRLVEVAFARFAEHADDQADLSIDLSTSSYQSQINGRALRPEYDGDPKDHALFHALLAGNAPRLSVRDTDNNRSWPIGLPAIEVPSRLAPSLDQVASRLVEGLVAIVARIADGTTAPIADAARLDTPPRSILKSASTFAMRRTTRKVGLLGDRLNHNTPRWHVAWRLVSSSVPEIGLRHISEFQVLDDGGDRYFADPFLFEHNGRRHVFIEELPANTGTGIISHFSILSDGKPTKPEPVLDTGKHLSYPQVFAQDGEIWMLPESAAAGGLDLYRAEEFPGRWVKHARLIEGRVHDATLFEHDGLLWIAAGSEAFQSSTWDALSLFYADKLAGPWKPHARNPVIVDARCARPAGPLWQSNGRLLRPAQDCSGGYGGKISVRSITKLSPSDFTEEAAGEITFDPELGLLGPHTIHCAGGIEVVDIYARPGALRAALRAGT